jgi:DNA polymerase-1
MALFIIDGNNVGMAAHFAADGLISPDGIPTGAIYNTLRMLNSTLERMSLDYFGEQLKVVCAWDNSPSWRALEMPEYKSTRKKNPSKEKQESVERYVSQLPYLRRVMSLCGISHIAALQQEADDIFGWLAKIYKDENIIIMTGDKDMLQLVSPNLKIWQHTKKRYVDVNNWPDVMIDFVGSKKQIFPENAEELVSIMAIAGDSGDDVPGVDGVGYAKALEFIRGSIKSGNVFDKINKWMQDENGFERSKRMIDLRDRDIDRSKVRIVNGQLNSIMADFDRFTQAFELCSKEKFSI